MLYIHKEESCSKGSVELVHPTCTSHLQREYQGANRAGAPWGLGPGREDSDGDRQGSPAEPWGRGWWLWAGLEWGSGPVCRVWGGVPAFRDANPYLRDSPDLEGRW